MKKTFISMFLLLAAHISAYAQTFNQIDEMGNVTQRNEQQGNKNFNPHNNDTTSSGKIIPQGIYSWTVDRRFGDIKPAVVDTIHHLYMNTTLNTGLYGEYNSTGNNFTARQSRIFADRKIGGQFIFTEPYSYINKAPDEMHYTNTLSPLANLSYDNCGDDQHGEDHLQAKFAVNANKRTGFGFDLNYAYARGYYNSQSTSHFGSTLYASYLGDRYNLHTMLSIYHQKASENGGIRNDEYIVHPELFNDSYSENEIPTFLERNWNLNDNLHFFLTHRYNIGFYKKEKMTEEEIKARKFAAESKKEREQEKRKKENPESTRETKAPAGRPDNAKIAGEEPAAKGEMAPDTTRIKVDSQAKLDSLLALEKAKEEDDSTMKKVFVPVTSFIHTLELDNYERDYIAYESPENYYAEQFYKGGLKATGDSIYDQTKMFQIKNTLALALLEGFNKYAKSGLKAFATHELRQFHLPDTLDMLSYQRKYTEHNVSVGGQLSKHEGKTWHYDLTAETWLIGEDAGQLKVDFNTDLNFPLLGDTVQLKALAYFYRLNPTFYHRNYHARNLWWDNGDMSKETRTRIEGTLSYPKTSTKLRVSVEEIQNYTYFGMSYDYVNPGYGRTNNYNIKGMTANVNQFGSNLNVMTAQLMQDFKLGPLHWDNIITYQNCSNTDVLPLPNWNFYSNLYLAFKIAGVLSVELGADVSYFTNYYAPDFCPQLNQFAVQQNEDSRVELGGYPFVNVYANMHLKRARFFVMMANATNGMANKMAFLAPHYPTNGSILRMGVSWNFSN